MNPDIRKCTEAELEELIIDQARRIAQMTPAQINAQRAWAASQVRRFKDNLADLPTEPAKLSELFEERSTATYQVFRPLNDIIFDLCAYGACNADSPGVDFDWENSEYRGILECEGYSYVCYFAGGDWEHPIDTICLFPRTDGGWQIYVPTQGNTFCVKCRAAYGTCECELDEDGEPKAAPEDPTPNPGNAYDDIANFLKTGMLTVGSTTPSPVVNQPYDDDDEDADEDNLSEDDNDDDDDEAPPPPRPMQSIPTPILKVGNIRALIMEQAKEFITGNPGNQDARDLAEILINHQDGSGNTQFDDLCDKDKEFLLTLIGINAASDITDPQIEFGWEQREYMGIKECHGFEYVAMQAGEEYSIPINVCLFPLTSGDWGVYVPEQGNTYCLAKNAAYGMCGCPTHTTDEDMQKQAPNPGSMYDDIADFLTRVPTRKVPMPPPENTVKPIKAQVATVLPAKVKAVGSVMEQIMHSLGHGYWSNGVFSAPVPGKVCVDNFHEAAKLPGYTFGLTEVDGVPLYMGSARYSTAEQDAAKPETVYVHPFIVCLIWLHDKWVLHIPAAGNTYCLNCDTAYGTACTCTPYYVGMSEIAPNDGDLLEDIKAFIAKNN